MVGVQPPPGLEKKPVKFSNLLREYALQTEDAKTRVLESRKANDNLYYSRRWFEHV